MCTRECVRVGGWGCVCVCVWGGVLSLSYSHYLYCFHGSSSRKDLACSRMCFTSVAVAKSQIKFLRQWLNSAQGT